jgi:hypothetical protein
MCMLLLQIILNGSLSLRMTHVLHHEFVCFHGLSFARVSTALDRRLSTHESFSLWIHGFRHRPIRTI